MEIRHLKLVKSLVDEGSLTKATQKLFVTQSALSHQLKELEQDLDSKLFDRVGKKLVLTPQGIEVYKWACEALEREERLRERLGALNGLGVGKLRISTGCYTSYHWLPSLLRNFEKDYPNVKIEIEVDSTGKTVEKLLEGKLDLGIVNRVVPNKYIDYSMLFSDQMVALVPSGHPWLKKEYVEAEDFLNEDLFIHSRPLETVTVYREVLKPENIQPGNIIELPLTEAVVEMISHGYGISVMARWAVQPYLDQKKVQRKSLIKFIFRKDRKPPLFMKDFLKYLKMSMVGKTEND